MRKLPLTFILISLGLDWPTSLKLLPLIRGYHRKSDMNLAMRHRLRLFHKTYNHLTKQKHLSPKDAFFEAHKIVANSPILHADAIKHPTLGQHSQTKVSKNLKGAETDNFRLIKWRSKP